MHEADAAIVGISVGFEDVRYGELAEGQRESFDVDRSGDLIWAVEKILLLAAETPDLTDEQARVL